MLEYPNNARLLLSSIFEWICEIEEQMFRYAYITVPVGCYI
jgi:hypothetical protein